MTSPAKRMGIVAGKTVLRVKEGTRHYHDEKDKLFQMRRDDGSSNPIVYPLGRETAYCFELTELEIVESVPVTTQATPVAPLPVPPPVFSDTPAGRMGIALDSTIVYYEGGEAAEGHYTMVHDDGTRIPRFKRIPSEEDNAGRCWLDLNFVKVVDPATVGQVADDGMTPVQRKALKTFTLMHEAVLKFRKGESSDLNPRSGICDNIDTFSDRANTRSGHMEYVKENLIRRTPSYSGSYHYPVPGANGLDAGDSFTNNNGNMWEGAYGENRIQILKEIIELIKTEWENDLTGDISPSRRVGLKVGDVVLYNRRDENSVWVLRHDDRSSSPSFHRIGKPNDYTDLDLSYIKKVPKTDFGTLTVGEFIAKLEEKEREKVEIEAAIKELQSKLVAVTMDTAVLDSLLAEQHKVARIK